MVKKKESINKKTILCVFLIILVIVVIAALFVLKTFIKKPALSPLIDSNLVAEYWFENDRHDYSIYGNDGICPVGNCPYYLEGKKGQSVFFDGADDYINISHNEPINLKNNFTISLWIDIDDSTTGYIFTKGNFTCCNQKGTSLRYNPATKKLELFIIDWPLMSAGFVIPNVLEDGWHHAALVFDGTNASVYIDGDLGRTMEFSGSIENINPITLGYKPGDEAFFKGSLDELRIHNRSLTGEEVFELYAQEMGDIFPPNLTFALPTPANNSQAGSTSKINLSSQDDNPHYSFLDFNYSLVAWYRMNGEAGENSTNIRDWSTYQNNASC